MARKSKPFDDTLPQGRQTAKAPKVKIKSHPSGPPKVVVATPFKNKPVGAPFAKAQEQAARRARAVPPAVLPAVPTLKHPTASQRAAAQELYATSREKALGGTPSEVGPAKVKAYEKNIHTGTQRKLRRIQRLVKLSDAQLAASKKDAASNQFKLGDLHNRLHLPGATIDLSPTFAAIGSHLKGNPVSALIHAPGALGNYASAHGGIIGRAANDAIDLPANVVTSTYAIGKEAATGHPVGAVKMLAAPIVETAKHPIRSFNEHPLNTVLIATGTARGADRAIGRVVRTSTERTARVLPGIEREVRRRHAPGPAEKTLQQGIDRVRMRRRVKKGRPAESRMSERDIRRAVDEDVQAAKIVTRKRQGDVAKRARKAIGRRATAAVSLAAQGITTASREDLARYLEEIRARAPHLNNDRERRASANTQQLIEHALSHHDEASVQRAAAAYAELAGELEAQTIHHGLVDPRTAEQTRLEGVRVRRVRRGSQPATAVARRAATAARREAKLEHGLAKAAYDEARAKVRAAGKPLADIPQAIVERLDHAKVALENAKATAKETRAVHVRAHMPAGSVEPAYVSHQPIEPRAAAIPRGNPSTPISADRRGPAVSGGLLDVHPGKLIEQAVGSQRLVDAAKAHARFIENWGYRHSRDVEPISFRSEKVAARWAGKRLADSGYQWAPMRKADGEFTLVPKHALDQLAKHESSVDAQHPIMRAAGSTWRKNVLAFSPRWFAGNMLEGAFRALVAGAGPTSYLSARRRLKYLDEHHPDLADELRARTLGGGHYQSADRVVNDPHLIRETADSLTGAARAMHEFWRKPGPKQLSQLYGWYTDFVFHTVNGRAENQFQTAMLGKAMRQHPLMGRKTIGLAARAAQEAAEGKYNTNTFAELGRQVDDMYGRYDKFSPELQGAVANYTPFISWTLNATKFLYRVMPRDHPVITALAASANEATEKWRKQHGEFMDFFGKTPRQLPPWLQGSIPVAGGHLRVSRYTPMGLLLQEGETPISGAAGLLLPQLADVTANLEGKDYTGSKLTENPSGARDAIAAIASIVEGQIPAASLALRIAGAKLPNQPDSRTTDPELGNRVNAALNPLAVTPNSSHKATSRRKRRPSTTSSSYGTGGYGSTYGGSSGYSSSYSTGGYGSR